MNFYQSINTWYEKIFPLNLKQIEYVNSIIPFNSKILEVGSAKGTLTNALSLNYNMIGIDLDESFVESAKNNYPHIDFKCLNMLNISDEFKNNSLDAIICFGNTLVHLNQIEEIDLFLKKCYQTLNQNGVITIQIINYDRILDQNINHLPSIKNDKVVFIRNYKKIGELLEFNTTLKIRDTNEEVSNSILLYPLRKAELTNLLLKNGFRDISFQSSFDNENYDISKIPLIVSCKK